MSLNIPWTAISEKLTTRNDATCCMKWYNQLTSSLVAEKKWCDADDYRMIGALYEMDAACVEDIDWDNVLEHRPGDICLKRWNQMVKHIGDYRSKSFGEQVDILAKRYCPDLAETREVWDNKPASLKDALFDEISNYQLVLLKPVTKTQVLRILSPHHYSSSRIKLGELKDKEIYLTVRILGRKVPPASTCRLAHFNSPPISALFQIQIQVQILIPIHFNFIYLVNLNPYIHLGGSVFVQDFTSRRLSYDLPMHLNLISA
ncbi:hypothetical protein L1987_19533 [Smallanthus sonchifolius]|uniref:Uncharacterized protein n=1 Tax=Smallanthus sonchifolius TaxID=185202 RepID=A0ACB9IRE4_9ASTR|nr:hypothetical protein L1987_19533 [Smallanthus sonchifolius]